MEFTKVACDVKTVEYLDKIPLHKIAQDVMKGINGADGLSGKWQIEEDKIIIHRSTWTNMLKKEQGTGAVSLVKHWLQQKEENKHQSVEEVENKSIKILQTYYDKTFNITPLTPLSNKISTVRKSAFDDNYNPNTLKHNS